jgi:peptide deformylase
MDTVSSVKAAEIVKVGHPALRLGTRLVRKDLFGSAALNELIEVMKATLKGNGVGLAAPQIAVPLRLFVAEDPEERMKHLSAEQRDKLGRHPFPFEAVINPNWRARSSRMEIETEGCLSIPGLKVDVPRYWEIEVEGHAPDGEERRWRIEGWRARIFQHEIDHLDGCLITDRMLPATLISTEPHGVGAPPDLLARLGL